MQIKNYILFSTLIFLFVGHTAFAGRAQIQTVAAEPYASAFVMDADTGDVLFARNADATVYPASTIKLMVLLVILDKIEQGSLQLDEMVQVTVEAYKMGGSQVYLDPKEQFPLQDLLYALMIQSANDAAVALASHVAGTKEAFVALMNAKAAELGMKNTRFHSVHGLPPAKGQKVDVTSARDFGILSRHLSKRPEVYQYTGAKVKDFRGGEFVMRTHNHLLNDYSGCDGFKTGYFTKAGFSIAATAKRNGVRIIAVVMGSKNRKVRDAKAMELLNIGFAKVPSRTDDATNTEVAVTVPQKKAAPAVASEHSSAPAKLSTQNNTPANSTNSSWLRFFMGVGVGFLLYAAIDFFRIKRRSKSRRGNRKL